MKIDKFLAYKIAGSDFKLLEVATGKVWDISHIVGDSLFLRDYDNWKSKSFDKIGTDYLVISRTMDLTKPITLQGKEVVLIEKLASIVCPYDISFCTYESGYDNNPPTYWANVVKNGNVIYSIEYIGNNFYPEQHESRYNFEQSDLFQCLEKHHFCYFLDKDMIVENDDVYNN